MSLGSAGADDLHTLAAALYALPPEEFTAARNARSSAARDAGARDLAAAVKALRRPTAGAWLLNRLVREHPDEVDDVLALGVRLRAAQGTLGAAELRALDTQRRALTRAVAQRAAALARDAGRTVTPAVLAAVEETLRSAMVDPDAGAALATGLLVDTFSASGLDPVDLSSVVAAPGAARPAGTPGAGPGAGPGGRRGASAARAAREEQARAQARRAHDEAHAALVAATEAADAARQRATAARRRREELDRDLDRARRAMAELEERVADAAEAESAARRSQLAATRDERAAHDAAARARRALERLPPSV
ncbi:hypothetical protein [Nostocoides sp. Soil756]|jgi:hypothetical protein|uniref:hypothetical protein n=1 Tax=Nostocoides sp. Soil756 TaxID=1736399 RepID=UPI0006FED3DE|nr:hypothetical protein [Tetrasphaera sp. Soil756]KRE63726.1 hypothetical protein ASG78_02300 [Tetrasphaera sp. Soil756]